MPPELLSTLARQAVFDFHGAAQTHHIGCCITPFNAFPAGVGVPVSFYASDFVFRVHFDILFFEFN
jgi:hypothetical protein